MKYAWLIVLVALCLPPLLCAAQIGSVPQRPGPTLADSIRPRPDTSAAKPGAVRTFEQDLRTSLPGDSVVYRPHHREHRHHHEDDDDDTSGFFSQLIGGIFRLAIEGYAQLPNPNYGPYPYYNASGFYAYGTGNKAYLIASTGYEHTYHDISSVTTAVKFSAAAFVLDAHYQQYQERAGGTLDRLHLTALRIGARKAAGSAVLWQNHIGMRYLKGFHDQTGGLIGTAFKIFPGGNTGVDLEYDCDFFPRYGTVFHDLTGSASYFIDRAELEAGYHALITYKGSSLHGPFFGISWHF